MGKIVNTMAILNGRAFRVSLFHPSTQHGKILLNILRWVLKSAHGHLFIVLFTFIFFIDDTQGFLIFYMAFITAVIRAAYWVFH